MAKEKLIPEPPKTEGTGPRAKFRELGTKVFSVTKAEIDRREQVWREQKDQDKDT